MKVGADKKGRKGALNAAPGRATGQGEQRKQPAA